ncbi:MAG: hypothetical protein VB138_14150 [Burkholderia sp.]
MWKSSAKRYRAWFESALEKVIARVRGASGKGTAGIQETSRDTPPETGVGQESDTGFPETLQEWQLRRKPTPATVAAMNKVLMRFWEITGKRPMSHVERTHIIKFQSHLTQSGASPATVRTQVSLLKALFGVALNSDPPRITANPAQGTRMEGPKNAKIARLPFDIADMKTIAGHLPAAGARKWIPLLGMHTALLHKSGARTE